MAIGSAHVEPETWRVIYQEICKSHNGIADFRARLLALLPIASGAAILAGGLKFGVSWPLVPMGVFGAVVTVGLLLYELRGIEDCTMLRYRAQVIEGRLHLDPSRDEGQFGHADPKLSLVDEVGAGIVVYITVIAGWAGLATGTLLHTIDNDHTRHHWYWVSGIIGAALYALVVAAAVWQRDRLVYRPYRCTKCDKKFPTPDKLAQHRAHACRSTVRASP